MASCELGSGGEFLAGVRQSAMLGTHENIHLQMPTKKASRHCVPLAYCYRRSGLSKKYFFIFSR